MAFVSLPLTRVASGGTIANLAIATTPARLGALGPPAAANNAFGHNVSLSFSRGEDRDRARASTRA